MTENYIPELTLEPSVTTPAAVAAAVEAAPAAPAAEEVKKEITPVEMDEMLTEAEKKAETSLSERA